LNSRNIQSYLRLNGFYATESELVAVIRRLDVDADQIIKYEEFCEALRPQTSLLESSGFTTGLPASRYEEEKRHHSPLRDTTGGLQQSAYLQ